MTPDSLPSLSIIIPALNEEHGIGNIVERVLAAGAELQKMGVACLEVIVVDDGSHDGTAAVVEALMAPEKQHSSRGAVRLLRHSQNRGYGAALKTGLAEADGDLIAFLDADGTYPPEYFPQLCRQALLQDL